MQFTFTITLPEDLSESIKAAIQGSAPPYIETSNTSAKKTRTPPAEPPNEKAKSEDKSAVKSEAKPEVPDRQELLRTAEQFMNEQGTEALSRILTELGIAKVSRCPKDKIPDLLARMATA